MDTSYNIVFLVLLVLAPFLTTISYLIAIDYRILTKSLILHSFAFLIYSIYSIIYNGMLFFPEENPSHRLMTFLVFMLAHIYLSFFYYLFLMIVGKNSELLSLND